MSGLRWSLYAVGRSVLVPADSWCCWSPSHSCQRRPRQPAEQVVDGGVRAPWSGPFDAIGLLYAYGLLLLPSSAPPKVGRLPQSTGVHWRSGQGMTGIAYHSIKFKGLNMAPPEVPAGAGGNASPEVSPGVAAPELEFLRSLISARLDCVHGWSSCRNPLWRGSNQAGVGRGLYSVTAQLGGRIQCMKVAYIRVRTH